MENYVANIMNMTDLTSAIAALLPIHGLIQLCTELLQTAPGFRINIMPRFLQKMVKHRLYTVSCILCLVVTYIDQTGSLTKCGLENSSSGGCNCRNTPLQRANRSYHQRLSLLSIE